MQTLPIRLFPGDDLRRELEKTVHAANCSAGFIIAGIGSLRQANIRLSGKELPEMFIDDFEILTLSGTVSADGAHLHISVSDVSGKVIGGHVGYESLILTTAEILLVFMPEWAFSRKFDPATGFPELIIRRQPPQSE